MCWSTRRREHEIDNGSPFNSISVVRAGIHSVVTGDHQSWELAATRLLRWPSSPLEAFGGRAHEAADYRSRTSSRTDLTLAARQLAQDIPQVVRHLLTLLRRKCLCELLDRPAPKRLDLRHQPGELVLILRFFGIGHTLYMATGACSNPAIVEYFQG